MSSKKFDNNDIFVGLWLLILSIMVYFIIIIGGLTRLNESGLSIVDWRPLLGIIPPLNQEDWVYVFEQYKKSPEYLIVNKMMQLSEFKYIFWWEYAHRAFARLIGFVFIIPFFYFLYKKFLEKKLIVALTIAFLFGIMQAVVGWWMVKSGLNDDPYVSQYRLSFHLFNALIILGILIWLTLVKLIPTKNESKNNLAYNLILISLLLCIITIISGSFVSGTDAGKSFNTFPLMDGKFFPEGYFIEKNIFLNFFENTIAIQFNHRWVAMFTFFWVILVITYISYTNLNKIQKICCFVVASTITFQIIIGILTLINNVPIIFASIHQANATLLYSSLITTLYFFSIRS